MGLRNVDIKVSYAGKGGDILKRFLLPSIDASVHYDRVTSFFTVESLLAISQGIESLYKKHGRMRLIIGIHSFPGEFLDAVTKKKYLENQISEIRKNLYLGLESLTDNLEKRRLATVAWMIEDHLLEIKTAGVIGDGIFHPKTFILTDENGDKIAAIGSPNETSSGLGGNFEQVIVVKSWEQPDAVTVQEDFFNALWRNELEDAITLDITEETAEIIKQGMGAYANESNKKPSTKNDLIKVSSAMLSNFFVSGDIPALYVHQERAVIDALSRWPIRVLFSDEVGLGKTFEVAATMSFMIKYCGVKRVLILTPKSVLKQWQDELKEHFKLNVWRYDSGSKSFIDSFDNKKNVGSSNPIGKGSPDIILMSAQYARGAGRNGGILSKEDSCLPELLVLDEAHSARVSRDISGSSKKTQIYSMLESVSNRIPHMILATATPMQKEAGEYHSLLKLLGLPKAWQKTPVYMKSLDLIMCGRQTLIGDTAQVGPMLSVFAKTSLITGVMSIEGIGKNITCLTRDEGEKTVSFPALLTLERINNLRLPSITSKLGSVEVLSAGDIGADRDKCGLAGSPTRVMATRENESGRRKCKFISFGELKAVIDESLKKSAPVTEQSPPSEEKLKKALDAYTSDFLNKRSA